VVVVDDQRIWRRVLEMMLKHGGFQVHTIDDSRCAVSEIRRLKPRVVLVDIMMPHVNGYEIASQLRGSPETASTLIIAVTTAIGPEHERRSTAVGIDRQLTKPVDQRELRQTIWAGLAGTSG
jgi:CheY-like chemotaxis protein